MRRISRISKLPLYHQLYEILRGNIVGGEWQPGDMILPESELIERYQVSRTTVRQVLDMLVSEGGQTGLDLLKIIERFPTRGAIDQMLPNFSGPLRVQITVEIGAERFVGYAVDC